MVTNTNNRQVYTLVVGLGLTGMSVVRFLRARGERVVVVDTREVPPGYDELKMNYPDVELKTGAFDEQLFSKAKQIIISPGIPLSNPEIQSAVINKIDVIGDVELFAREVTAPVIAITGSNGKSTVTTLVGEMARKAGINVAVGGNIGVPVLDLLKQNADLYVLELSSFQLETLYSLKPVAATVLNISPDHMDRYQDISAYAKVKQHVYEKTGCAVVNRDDEYVKAMSECLDKVTGFSLSESAENDFGLRIIEGDVWLCKGQQKLIAEKNLKIAGRHNTANALAALALGEAANIPMIAMLEALREFSGLAHRTQWVAEHNDVIWINDSKGTNVGATLAAIEGLNVENRLLLIAGGLAKDADFSSLKNALKEKARCLILLGRDAKLIEKDLNGVVAVHYATSMEDAVNIANDLAESGDTVLLSPACASFDMFDGYEQRGEVFIQAVEMLP
ncbi:MAG: UDP-N-acetylmuramoyl-L-alanine--D-glutamate ligase [Gammaproteobacteria bacterium]|nr:UDP-N-acetylmuramoyl-L-alanine--D-glutamate ligase [Gammaproteobacteria bacterium]MCW8910513.1 UDP-N-acetylmuramoyl-L-alanine--D-glutamate ligase [Gammaproteobacteria bacterium]MCW9005409.1 UDP-N-acetylmuramoyl-L-alanine--D-glutamate ligase [Gammaproteobacteria bacterium]MCW9055247.1 UDP-N-acetylmuramoyl-L-alanine--D-glutamate ligase [Gammaproteobacteria bacterium]